MKTSAILFRRILEQDLDQVAALEEKAFPTPWTADQYRIMMRQGGCVLFGAFHDTILAGYIAVSPNAAGGEMEVYNIAVDSPFRRLGIGKKLLGLSLDAAAKNGAERAVLEVRVSNAPAVALYRSLAFEQAGIRAGYYHDTGEDALVLVRPLVSE